jgi:hypothetical protein
VIDRVRTESTWRPGCGVLLALAAVLLASCGGVKVAPTASLPRALIQKLPVKVGVVVAQDMLDYKHQETRGGVTWEVSLGPGHQKFAMDTLGAAFAGAQQFRTLDEAKAAKDLAVIFEPRIELFSFATARDTGSNYYAATIQYRIHVYNPAGERVDSFSLTGYGNSMVGRAMSGSEQPMIAATGNAMRDAAAKFMVQFPEQKLAQQLQKGEPLLAQAAGGNAVDALAFIEAVPIKDQAN